MIKELTHSELKKLKEFDNVFREYLSNFRKKSIWNKITYYMADMKFRKEMCFDFTEMFLTHTPKEARREIKRHLK